MNEDLYSELGVLPDAEDVVIKAAYRALAQRFHPDKWRGDPHVANARMARINRAFETLGDPQRRVEYDRRRETSGRAQYGQQGDDAGAFDAAMLETDERWRTACSVYPDLEELRGRLSKVSSSLAFAYVETLLERKSFRHRVEIADRMELAFLQRYFGANQQVLEFARGLIAAGERFALLRLNQIVDVLGSDVDASDIINRVLEDHPQGEEKRANTKPNYGKSGRASLVQKVLDKGNYSDALELARASGFQVSERDDGIFLGTRIHVVSPIGEVTTFPNRKVFVGRVRVTLCRQREGEPPSINLK